jgi:hypothetical protein
MYLRTILVCCLSNLSTYVLLTELYVLRSKCKASSEQECEVSPFQLGRKTVNPRVPEPSPYDTLDGIILGCSPTSNAILVYNPRNQKYYEPDSYKIDPHCLPSSL